MARSGTTSEGRTKVARWHESPPGSRLPPVAEGFDEPTLTPPRELAERVAGQVLVHLLAGRWPQAHIALTEAEKEVRELLGNPSPMAMSVGDRLKLPVVDMCLPTRETNGLESLGLTTVGRVVAAWPLRDAFSYRGNAMGVEGRTRVAKILRDWNLLTQDQARQAASEGLINRWWHDHDPVDSA